MPPFQVVSPFQPTGDQPKAIDELVEGVEKGLKQQVLLGATGTGKSLGYNDTVFVVEKRGTETTSRLVAIGELIDSQIADTHTQVQYEGDTEILDVENGDVIYYAQAFDPKTCQVALYPIRSFVRHQTPERMYRLRTACGRSAMLTGDHNLWVLREGKLQLICTAEAKSTDYIPVPETLMAGGDLQHIDTLAVLDGKRLFVQASEAILSYTRQHGASKFNEALLDGGIGRPDLKLSAIRHNRRGNGIETHTFQGLLTKTDNLGGYWKAVEASIGGKARHNRLPAHLKLTPEFLRLMGYYIAEGNHQRGYIILANRNEGIRNQIEAAVTQLGIPFSVRPSSDYQISSTALTELFSRLCGDTARDKRLPEFWTQLADKDLGHLLSAYFDGDGTVGKASDVMAATASQQLASELMYALLRFGIWARLSRRWKRATNTDHAGDWYYYITISGQTNLRRFQQHVGFTIGYKTEALQRQLKDGENSNTDIVPIDGSELRWLREELGLFAREVAEGCDLSRSAIQAIESGKRKPQRTNLRRMLKGLRIEAQKREQIAAQWWNMWHHLNDLCQLHWTPVESVEQIEYTHPYVYDFCVPGVENFLAGLGGFFVHNTFSIAKIIEQTQKPALILAHNKTLAAQLYAEFREFFPRNAVEYYVSYYDYYQPESYVPRHDLFIEKQTDINRQIENLRIASKASLLSRRDVIIIASVSCIYATGDPETWGSSIAQFHVGESVKREAALRQLVNLQYTRNDMVLEKGDFRARGDTLEVFPPYIDYAFRIVLFGDEIERIVEFDPLTGEVLNNPSTAVIFPAAQFMADTDKLQKAIHDIEQELEQQIAFFKNQGKLLEAQRIEQRTRYDIEMLREMGFTSGIENYSRHLDQRLPGSPPYSLIDYFPKDYLLVIDESHMTIPQLHGMYNGDRTRKSTLIEYGFRLPSALDNRPLKFEEIEERMGQTIYTSATPGPYEMKRADAVVQQIIRPTGVVDPQISVRPVEGQIDDLLQEVALRVKKGQRAIITTLTQKMAEELAGYLNEVGVRAHHLHAEIQTLERVEILRDLRMGVYDAVVGINLLREGIDLPEVSLVAILDADKEGFLRSEQALVQIIGRAARHIEGQVILYANRMTDSMKGAIGETERRRAIQEAYNTEHNIEPASIIKEIRDLTDRIRSVVTEEDGIKAKAKTSAADLTKDELHKLVKALEKEMKDAAKALEFEKAAALRDQLFDLRGMLAEKDPDLLLG